MNKKRNKTKKEESARQLSLPVVCPGCGRKGDASKSQYCRACGRDFYTPVIGKKSIFKILITILLILALIYVLFIIFKDSLYYWLDKVPHKPY